jgi:hypothetical protein
MDWEGHDILLGLAGPIFEGIRILVLVEHSVFAGRVFTSKGDHCGCVLGIGLGTDISSLLSATLQTA